jgi:hypothetical protein
VGRGRFVSITLRLVGIALVALALVGCGVNDDGGSVGESTADASAASRVDRCTDRFVARAETSGHSDTGVAGTAKDYDEIEEEEFRRYAETTYCSRFAKRGWVYEDGTLSIAAHEWIEEGGEEECSQVTETGEETVPCEEIGGDPIIDCALLHHVRQNEVRKYVEELRRLNGNVECDDGTPLDELGAP